MRRRRRRRAWEGEAEDPTAGLANLFDAWIVFSVALLLALASLTGRALAPEASEEGAEGGAPEAKPLDDLNATGRQLGGRGQRLGTAYKLESGEVVYIPD